MTQANAAASEGAGPHPDLAHQTMTEAYLRPHPRITKEQA
jgi:hypothetical protein